MCHGDPHIVFTNFEIVSHGVDSGHALDDILSPVVYYYRKMHCYEIPQQFQVDCQMQDRYALS